MVESMVYISITAMLIKIGKEKYFIETLNAGVNVFICNLTKFKLDKK